MAKLLTGLMIAACVLALGISGFLHLRKNSAAGGSDLPAGSRPAASGKSAFAGDSGYLLQFPSEYDVYAEMRGKTELVFFYPKGTKLTSEEKQYKALGIIRLEVSAPPKINGSRATLEDLKKGVEFSLTKNKETFKIKDADLGRAAFQANITLPNEITQLFVDGKDVFYVFTGADEALMRSLAQSIVEVGPPYAPKAP
jgi:hypothetical protein